MKKIFTILLAVGTVSFASAQSSHNNNWGQDQRSTSHDVAYGQRQGSGFHNNNNNVGTYDSHSFGSRDKDEQNGRINRQFDQQVNADKWDRQMRQGERNRQIRFRERQRDEQMRDFQNRYDDSRRLNDHFDNRKW